MHFLENVVVFLSPLWSIIFCLVIGSSFVISLYVGTDRNLNRDHPKTVTNRFTRVSFSCLFSIFLFSCCCTKNEKGKTVLQLLGFKLSGLLCALIVPLLHTVILFSGPLLQNYYNGVFIIYKDLSYWKNCFRNHLWIRSHIVGPISEEIVYRACMLPMLVPNFGECTSILLSPLFFGVAHFHHMYASIKEGVPVKNAIIKACFQFTYTTLFGIYSAFLFVRTGNIMPCILTHMFCNHMGFPNFMEVMTHHDSIVKSKVIKAYVIGLVLFLILLVPLTAPSLYNNLV